MASGDLLLRHNHLLFSRQSLSADSAALLSGVSRVSARRTTNQNIPGRNIQASLSYHNLPIIKSTENTSNTKEEINLTLQVSDSNKIKQGLLLIKAKLKSIDDGELSISAYDTAWVALVKDPHRSDAPLFPTSVQWIVNNQLPDGSWGDSYFFSSYDRLLCTLACVVALKTWNTNPEGCDNGMSFLRQNMHRLKDEDPEHQLSGFEVVFPTLIEMAHKLGLDGLEDFSVLPELYAKREEKLKRIPMETLHSVPTTLLHSLEGIPDLDWEKLLKLQHPNGSFLCSTSSTSYALMQTQDEKCFRYLDKIVQRFNGGVPHSYPIDLFERLWVVDRLERLGISRYFQSNIKEFLDYVYRFWTPDGISWSRNTIELDIDDTSMGFRMLRLHGYDVKADVFHHFEREGQFYCFVGQTSQGITEMLSLYRASEVLFPGEKILEQAKHFAYKSLRQKQDSGQISDRWLITKDLPGEVQYYLDLPWYASLPRIETRYYIDHYGGDDDVWIAKALYRMYNVSNNLYLEFAKLDYNCCQEIHQQEWIDIQMWYEELNLGEFGLSKDALLRCYFLSMANLFEPAQAAERFAWSGTAALIEVVSLHFKDISRQQQNSFIQSFNSHINSNNNRGAFNVNGNRNELVEAIFKTLSKISLKVQEVSRKQVYQALKFVWNTWLSSLVSTKDDILVPINEAEVILRTISLCSGHFSIDLVSQPEYIHLTDLTNEICNCLHQTQDFTVGKKKKNMETMQLQMQELLQTITNSRLHAETKHTFLSVAKSYYYSAFCSPDAIDLHISRVLFERAV